MGIITFSIIRLYTFHHGVPQRREREEEGAAALPARKHAHRLRSESFCAALQGDTLRTKAARKLHGENGENPSQLGDPISLKAETSERVPTNGEAGSTSGTTLRGSEEGKDEASRDSRQSKL